MPLLLFLSLRIPAWFVQGLWFLLQWAYSAGMAALGAGSVAYLAHMSGFLAGRPRLPGHASRRQARPARSLAAGNLAGSLAGIGSRAAWPQN